MTGVEGHRGVSTFAAVLLLLILALATGATVYAYSMGLVGGFGGMKPMASMSLDAATLRDGMLTVYLRNTGKTPLGNFTMYIDGEVTATPPAVKPDPLGEGEAGSFQMISGFTPGKTYQVKVISGDGTYFVFNIKAS